VRAQPTIKPGDFQAIDADGLRGGEQFIVKRGQRQD
jgi:hypothetical protein